MNEANNIAVNVGVLIVVIFAINAISLYALASLLIKGKFIFEHKPKSREEDVEQEQARARVQWFRWP